MATTAHDRDLQQSGPVQPAPEGRIGLIVAASLAIGLVAVLALVAAPFIPANEHVLTGVMLLAFTLGWALLDGLSTRFSTQPQRWPAACRPGVAGLHRTETGPGPATRTESYSVLGRVSAVFSAVAHLGAGRLIAQASYGSLPPHFGGEARANASTAPYLRSWIEEFVAANTGDAAGGVALLVTAVAAPVIGLFPSSSRTCQKGSPRGSRAARERSNSLASPPGKMRSRVLGSSA